MIAKTVSALRERFLLHWRADAMTMQQLLKKKEISLLSNSTFATSMMGEVYYIYVYAKGCFFEFEAQHMSKLSLTQTGSSTYKVKPNILASLIARGHRRKRFMNVVEIITLPSLVG
jgi:hypothetical protein